MKKNLPGFLAIVIALVMSAFTINPSSKVVDPAQYWFDGQTFVLEGTIDDAKMERPGCDVDPGAECLQGYGSDDVDIQGSTPVLLQSATVNEEIFEQ